MPCMHILPDAFKLRPCMPLQIDVVVAVLNINFLRAIAIDAKANDIINRSAQSARLAAVAITRIP